ncbi:MAG: ketopantoate reductase family protein [Deltaproteobacteria bacterium]|nr:ketopantoate reductase family protein [Deltaproteobacteria bacterium]
MKIALIGPGAIGSTFAYQLSRAGHEVTVVARGARLAYLQGEGAIVLGSGERAPVTVADALDATTPWDLVMVTVLAHQVQAVLPALQASAARQVMFLFNTFESIEPLRDAVGRERALFGFPMGIFALLREGRVLPQIRVGTVSSDPAWAKVFSAAGIPTSVEPDMQGWLRTHVAVIAPMMTAAAIAFGQKRGLTWAEAGHHIDALRAGLDAVRAVGSAIRPPLFGPLARLPRFVLAGLFWIASRTRMVHDLGSMGPTEPRLLIDMMRAAAPSFAGPLEKVRP